MLKAERISLAFLTVLTISFDISVFHWLISHDATFFVPSCLLVAVIVWIVLWFSYVIMNSSRSTPSTDTLQYDASNVALLFAAIYTIVNGALYPLYANTLYLLHLIVLLFFVSLFVALLAVFAFLDRRRFGYRFRLYHALAFQVLLFGIILLNAASLVFGFMNPPQ